jgi:aryl carrier-like protein
LDDSDNLFSAGLKSKRMKAWVIPIKSATGQVTRFT